MTCPNREAEKIEVTSENFGEMLIQGLEEAVKLSRCPNREAGCCLCVNLWGQEEVQRNPDGTLTLRSRGLSRCCHCGKAQQYDNEDTITPKQHGRYRRKDAA